MIESKGPPTNMIVKVETMLRFVSDRMDWAGLCAFYAAKIRAASEIGMTAKQIAKVHNFKLKDVKRVLSKPNKPAGDAE